MQHRLFLKPKWLWLLAVVISCSLALPVMARPGRLERPEWKPCEPYGEEWCDVYTWERLRAKQFSRVDGLMLVAAVAIAGAAAVIIAAKGRHDHDDHKHLDPTEPRLVVGETDQPLSFVFTSDPDCPKCYWRGSVMTPDGETQRSDRLTSGEEYAISVGDASKAAQAGTYHITFYLEEADDPCQPGWVVVVHPDLGEVDRLTPPNPLNKGEAHVIPFHYQAMRDNVADVPEEDVLLNNPTK